MESLLLQCYDRCYALCRRLLCDDILALDAAQESLISIARGIDALDERTDLTTWTCRVTADAVFDEATRSSGQPSWPPQEPAEDAGQDRVQPGGGEESSRVDVAAAEQAALDRAIALLPEEQRTALVLRDMLDLEYGAIAEVLLTPVAAVGSLIASGRTSLAQALSTALPTGVPAAARLFGRAGGPPGIAARTGRARVDLASSDHEHPTSAQLSALLDGVLAGKQQAEELFWRVHTDACIACRRELEQLSSAREAIVAGGRPAAPRGARDRAVIAALFVTSLSLVAQAARDSSSTIAAGPPPKAQAGGPHKQRRRRPLTGVASLHPRPVVHAVPRAARLVAVLVVLAAVAGGLFAVLSPQNQGKPSTAPPESTTQRSSAGSSTPPSSTTVRTLGSLRPAIGVLALQLRREIGPVQCAKAVRRIENIDGVFVALNPPPKRRATVAVPSPRGAATNCVTLGPAIATLWSGNIKAFSADALPVTQSSATGASPTVHVVIEVIPSALASAAAMHEAQSGNRAIAVVAQGADLGRATVADGPTLSLLVSPAVASFLAKQLVRPHHPRTG